MAAWCLTKQAEAKLLEALKADGNPQKMVDRGTEGRLKWFADQVGKENAENLNLLFEKKMLLKNQQAGFRSFVQRMGGSPTIKRDFLSKVDRLETALSKTEVDTYLQQFVSQRLGFEALTENQFKVITEMANKVDELTKEFNPEKKDLSTTLSTDASLWKSQKDADLKGATQRALENFVEDIKAGKTLGQIMRQRGTRFKEEFAKNRVRAIGNLLLDTANQIAQTSTPLVASLDNSLFGRQGVMTLLTGRPKIWARNFGRSFRDLVQTFGGKETTDVLMAKAYSDPLFMNGEYVKAKIIDLVEEQYPTSLPGRASTVGRSGRYIGKKGITLPIRVFGKAYKASEAAFVNGSLRMRMELYTMLRDAKVARGIEMTEAEIIGTGKIVNSILARGDLGRHGGNSIVRLLMWAPRMLKADIDILTAHAFSDIPKTDRMTALGNLTKIVAITTVIEGVATANDKESTELDPRSSDFLKVYGFSFLRGAPQIITLLARMAPDSLGGGKYKNKKGELVEYDPGFGKTSRLDALYSFLRGKAPPATGGVYDILDERDYEGNVPTFSSLLLQRGVAISVQNLLKFSRDPSIDKAFGIVGDFFGFGRNISPEPNAVSEIIPQKEVTDERDLIETVQIFAKAANADPEDAVKKFFSGQKIMQVSDGGIIVVDRQSIPDSEAFKEEWVAEHGGDKSDIKEVRLDHVIPNKLGGDELENNWAVVTTTVWKNNTKVETRLIAAVKKGKISKKDAQELIRRYKRPSVDSEGYVTIDPDEDLREEILAKY